jgi:hypothetical protein
MASQNTDAKKRKLLRELELSPIIEIGCKRTSVSRATYYRWMLDDPEFNEAALEALRVSTGRITDMAISTIAKGISEGDIGASKWWLALRDPDFARQPIQREPDPKYISPTLAVLQAMGILVDKPNGKKRNKFL